MTIGHPDKPCPHGEEILAYARQLGVRDPALKYAGLYGWMLCGEGKSRRPGGGWPKPLIWQVADDCNLQTGGGSATQIQINPVNFKAPSKAKLS